MIAKRGPPAMQPSAEERADGIYGEAPSGASVSLEYRFP
jgi:hypothetical protein